MNYRAPLTQMVELIIPANITTGYQNIYFQNQPQLQSVLGDRKVYIQAMETFSNLHIAGSPLTAGSPVAAPADIVNGVLTLNVAGTLQFQMIPLASLVRTAVDNNTSGINNVHNYDLFRFRDLFQVDWTKSYVTVITAPTSVPFSYLFQVFYSWNVDAID